MDKGKVFELEISRLGFFGAATAVVVSLPATPYELTDALDKARITDERVIYSTEIISCELDYLPQFINPSTNLYELNHLAHRLSQLSDWELDCFEGVVMMDAVQTKYEPISVERIINMTHSTEQCQIIYEAHDDLSLGKFYAENDFVPELETLSERIFPWLDYGKIGKEMREGEGGVFIPNGYVVQNGEISQTYQSGDAVPREKPDYTVLLKVTKGYFNDPEYDNESVVFLKLPASDKELSQAVEAVDAASPEECEFTAVNCITPHLTEKITDALYESDGDCYGMVNELARQLQRMKDRSDIPTYKAMLEVAPKNISLEDALDLSYQTAGFILYREMASPVDYANAELQKLVNREQADTMEKSISLYDYGKALIEQQSAVQTEYGILRSTDGQSVEQCLERPDQSHGMDMK